MISIAEIKSNYPLHNAFFAGVPKLNFIWLSKPKIIQVVVFTN
jgi:hypothetical protein